MKNALIIGALALAVWALLSWGTTSGLLEGERVARARAESRTQSLATEVAYWKPTPVSCHPYYSGSSRNWC